MRVYLMRHGHAEPAGIDTSDHDRRLTERGKERIADAARVLRALEIAPDVIFSSPRIRARQTAEIVGETLGVAVTIHEEVNFGFSVTSIRRLTADLPTESSVLFVGHEPSMSVITGELTGAEIAMKKGGIARIDLAWGDLTRGELVWLITPKVFDALGGQP